MNIEQYSDHIQGGFFHLSRTFQTALQTVVNSSDYAHVIATMTRTILADDPERELSLNHLGLVYCAFVIPSKLFPVPVKVLFPIKGEFSPVPAGQHLTSSEGIGDSFFNPFGADHELIQVQFVQDDKALGATATKNRKNRGNLVLVSEDFLKYLGVPDDRESGYDNIDDPRYRLFMSRNREVIEHLFGYFDDEPGGLCPAFKELASIRQLSQCRANYVYLVPCKDSHRGVFAFFFRQPVSSRYRNLLRIFSYLLFIQSRSLDYSEYQRRAVILGKVLSHAYSDFHDMRSALGTLQNKLQTLRSGLPVEGDSRDRLQSALESHSQALAYLDKIESSAVEPAMSSGDVTTLRMFKDLFLNQFDQRDRKRFLLKTDRDRIDQLFELPGSARELVQGLFQVVDGAMAPVDEHTEQDKTPRGGVSMDLALEDDNDRSTLLIWVDSSAEWPVHIKEAIQTVSILGRLPSRKFRGGRGVLSAVELIRNQYQGECTLTESSAQNGRLYASWGITIPVRIIRQLSLFHSDDWAFER